MKMTIFAAALAATCLGAAPAAAHVFGDWDLDDDGLVAEAEFTAGLGAEEFWEEWDADDDGLLDEDEFEDGLFNEYDADDDGLLDDEEWDGFDLFD